MSPEAVKDSRRPPINDDFLEQELVLEGHVPPSHEGMSLHRTTAVENTRYATAASISLQYIDIPAGLHSNMHLPVPFYLAPGWTSHVNPEGTPYYVNDSDPLVVVTDVQLHRRELYEKVALAVGLIQCTIKTLGYILPANCEVYVHVDSATETCNHYLIDHDTRTEFWLQDCDSHSIALPAVASAAHLKYVLQEHYWTHVEYFPHRSIDTRAREELIDVLRQACGDQLTSNNSTLPWNAEQCAKFIGLLDVKGMGLIEFFDTSHDSIPPAGSSIYMTWTAARVWISIARHRFQNYYGEDFARLDREQRRLAQVPVQPSRAMDLCSFFLIGAPKALKNELELLSIDGLVYINQWNKFAVSQRQHWRETSLLSFGLLVTDAGFLSFPGAPALTCTGLASTFLSLCSLSSSVALLQQYSDVSEPSAAVVVRPTTS